MSSSSSPLFQAHWDTLITPNRIAQLKSDHFIVIDDFLPPSSTVNDDGICTVNTNYYQQIINLSKRNELTREESYMEDEDSGQVVRIGQHPFYTLKMQKKEHYQSSKEHTQLYSLTTHIGQYFQKLIFKEIINNNNSTDNNDSIDQQSIDDDFFNKVALCKDFDNGLPVHLDNHNADTRKITVVYYTTPYVDSVEEKREMELKYPGITFEIRNWQGGLLRVFKPSTKLYINHWETEKVDIEPRFNRAVIFFSDTIVHTVTETKPIKLNTSTPTTTTTTNSDSHGDSGSSDSQMHPPRTTVTTWIHCRDWSHICKDKVLFQRQMIKFFQDN